MKHYEYKVYLGETLRDNLPYLKIDYEFTGLPSFFSERHNKFVNYQPDIFIEWHDDQNKLSFFSDIEINGLVHYKSKEQILKIKERKNHIYPVLSAMKAANKPDYKTISSYIIIEKDDFEYSEINDIYAETRGQILSGGVFPVDLDIVLDNYLKVAK